MKNKILIIFSIILALIIIYKPNQTEFNATNREQTCYSQVHLLYSDNNIEKRITNLNKSIKKHNGTVSPIGYTDGTVVAIVENICK